jgi:Uri superfamily endonuclease
MTEREATDAPPAEGVHAPGPVVLSPDAVAAGTDELGVGSDDAPPGTYSLLYELSETATVDVGALGVVEFPPGAYAYVGSAFGSNGLGRVDRHARVAAGRHDVRHWHVDYLGGNEQVRLTAVVARPHADVECAVAAALDPTTSPVSGFGSSDCDCEAHLARRDDGQTLRSTVVNAFEGKE